MIYHISKKWWYIIYLKSNLRVLFETRSKNNFCLLLFVTNPGALEICLFRAAFFIQRITSQKGLGGYFWLPYPPFSRSLLSTFRSTFRIRDYLRVQCRFIVGSYSNEKRSNGVRIGNACFNNSAILKIWKWELIRPTGGEVSIEIMRNNSKKYLFHIKRYKTLEGWTVRIQAKLLIWFFLKKKRFLIIPDKIQKTRGKNLVHELLLIFEFLIYHSQWNKATTEHAKISMNVKKITSNAEIGACASIGSETIPVLIPHVQYRTKQERSKIKES